MLEKNIWYKISKSGSRKDDVYSELIKLRKAMLETLGGVDYSSEIFFKESCIYMDVLKILLDKGFLVWQVYDCFYAKGPSTQEEFEKYVKDAVYISFVSYKFNGEDNASFVIVQIAAKYNNDWKNRIVDFIKDLNEEERNQFELCIIIE